MAVAWLDPPASPGLPKRHVHAVVFLAGRGFAEEFRPLAVDAYERDAVRLGRQGFHLYGVRADELDAWGRIRRALWLDPEHDCLRETACDPPLVPDSAQFLCLGPQEQALHRPLSARIPGPQVNPYAVSALADDKAATLEGWAALGLEIPRFRRIGPGRWPEALEFLQQFPEGVIKPNGGTEGQGVAYLSRSAPDFAGRLREGLENSGQWDAAAIVQQRRDGVLFRDPLSGGLHTLALRLNLVWDGRGYCLASGFAQIGAGPDLPASCGQGGRILALDEALACLAARDGRRPQPDGLDPALWENLAELAVRAAGLFQGLLLVGLDVLLDLDSGGRLVPVFLEANPRPAGLRHARLVSGVPSPRGLGGVGPALWDGVAALCA